MKVLDNQVLNSLLVNAQIDVNSVDFLLSDKLISRENVIENYTRFCNTVGIDINNLVLSRQTHTDNIKNITASHKGTGIFNPSFNDIDGLITNESNIALVTQYADCTPLLFCDPVKKVIASSHAGWRGTVKEIGKKTVEKMVDDYGCNTNNIIACIGPNICMCCYEVDEPVAKEFRKLEYLHLNTVLFPKGDGKYMLNLTEANKQILLNAGIKENNMDISDICTCCNCEELHSHRATNGERGNLAAVIQLI
jgi:YfiH family protein